MRDGGKGVWEERVEDGRRGAGDKWGNRGQMDQNAACQQIKHYSRSIIIWQRDSYSLFAHSEANIAHDKQERYEPCQGSQVLDDEGATAGTAIEEAHHDIPTIVGAMAYLQWQIMENI